MATNIEAAISNETQRPQFELRDDGEIHLNRRGKSTLLAKYDDETGILIFESFEIDQKYRHQIADAVMQNPMSGELTGHAIKAYRIHGRPGDKKKAGEPPPPKRLKQLGDKTPEYVKWLYRWRPQAFYARFGVFLDSNGDPVRGHCVRVEQGLISPQEGTKATVVQGDGADALDRTRIEIEDAMLATRATCLTFLKNEQVGYEDEDVADEEPLLEGEDSEPVEEEEQDAPPARRRRAKAGAEEKEEIA